MYGFGRGARSHRRALLGSSGGFDATYYSLLNSAGLISTALAAVEYDGTSYQADAGATWAPAGTMGHSITWSGKKKRVRFETRDTNNDASLSDPVGKRRAELDGKTVVPVGVERWMAFSLIPETFTDPTNMATTLGLAYFQLHFGTGGGSPSIGIRRLGDGRVWVTTRGTGEPNSINRYIDGSVAVANVAPFDPYVDGSASIMGTVEDWVLRFTSHPTAGAVQIWRNGVSLMDMTGIAVGQADGSGYPKFGIYAAGGQFGMIASQFANVVHPQAASLAARVISAPAWPQDLRQEATAPTVSARGSSDSGTTNLNTWVPALATHAAGDYLMLTISVDSTDTPATISTAEGWLPLVTTLSGTAVHQLICYYAGLPGTSPVAGVMRAAPGQVTAPTVTMSFEQAAAISHTIQATSAPTIEAPAGTAASSTFANPPAVTLAGGTRSALFIATMGIDSSTTPSTQVTAGPCGYDNYLYKPAQGVTSAVAGGVATAEFRMKGTGDNPGPFTSLVKDWVAHTIAISVP